MAQAEWARRSRWLLPTLGLLATNACAPSTEADERPGAVLIGSPTGDKVLGFAVDGAGVIVARDASLERIDSAGATVRLAGPEYRACPTDASKRWQPGVSTATDVGFLSARDGVLTLADPSCGLWSRQLESGATTMLVQSSGGQDLPAWAEVPSVVAVQADAILWCFGAKDAEFGSRAEVWSVARDGSQRRRLAQLPGSRPGLPRSLCSSILADESAVFVIAPDASTMFNDTLFRIDRREGTVTPLSDTSVLGVTQDQDAVYYFDDAELVRFNKATGQRTPVTQLGRRAGETNLTRGSHIVSDGTFLYVIGTETKGRTIERFRIRDGARETLYNDLSFSGATQQPNLSWGKSQGWQQYGALWAAPGFAVRNGNVYFAYTMKMETFAVAHLGN